MLVSSGLWIQFNFNDEVRYENIPFRSQSDFGCSLGRIGGGDRGIIRLCRH